MTRKSVLFYQMIVMSGLIAFTSFTVCATAPSSDEEVIADLHRSFKKIDDKLAQDLEIIKSFNISQQKTVIVLGMTGAGKSTLINFLAENPLKSTLVRRRWQIDVTEELLPGVEIGHGLVSKTSEPSYWYNREDRIYFDTPGFADNRSPEHEIKNMYAIRRLLELYDNTRIIIAVSAQSFTFERDTVSTASNLINLLGALIKPNDAEQFCKGTCLIVTRQPSSILSEAQLIENIRADLIDTPVKVENNHFLNNLAEHAQIAFLPQPEEEGSYLDLFKPKGRSVYDRILRELNQTTVITNIGPQLVFSDRTIRYSFARFNTLKKEIDEFLTQQLITNIYRSCEAKIHDSDQTDIQQLRNYFKNLAAKLDNVQSTSLTSFKQSIRTVLQDNNMAEVYNDLTTKIDNLAFLQLINPTVNFALNEWLQPFINARSGIKALAQLPKHKVLSDGTLIFKGLLISTSDIKKVINENVQVINNIEAYSLNTLLIDVDLKLPGQSLILIAPHWQILNTQAGPRIIDLSGNHGAKGVDGSYPGGDGQPGQNGQHGGHFLGKGLTFNSLDQLTVKTDGGNGGDGGRSGDGVNGEDGVDGLFDKITSSNQFYVQHVYGWLRYEYYNDHGTDGSIGGDSGKRGVGGKKGLQGQRVITQHTWFDTSKNGQNGQSGATGTPGAGGLHGKHIKGIGFKYFGTLQNWIVTHEFVDRGRALNGQAPQVLNSNNSQTQTLQPHFPNKNVKLQIHQKLFEKKLGLLPFVKRVKKLPL